MEPDQATPQIPDPVIVIPTAPTPEPNKTIIYLISAVIVLLIIIGGLIGYFILNNNSPKGPVSKASLGKGGKSALLTIGEDLSKYDKDSDGDGYPDFVETQMGLDPNQSQYTICKNSSGCGSADLNASKPKTKNVMIILDASGSMGLNIDGRTRMDAAKAAIRGYVNSVKTDTKLGLFIYGHKGSNSTSDKPLSCAGAEQVAPIGQVDSASIDGYLAGIKPTGWTPMGLAIKNSTNSFPVSSDQYNEIILVTDGDETCNSNPIDAAREIYASTAKVKVNVIGFAVSANEQNTLSGIALAGGGTFSVASSSQELIDKLDELQDNLSKIGVEVKCRAEADRSFIDCYSNINRKVGDYVFEMKRGFYKKEISKAEYDRLGKLEQLIFDQGQKALKEKDEKLNDALDKSRLLGR